MPRIASKHDREVVRLAVPALGAPAAEPLYLLTDTAIAGHLGTTELAAVALAATVRAWRVVRPERTHGRQAGDHERAVQQG